MGASGWYVCFDFYGCPGLGGVSRIYQGVYFMAVHLPRWPLLFLRSLRYPFLSIHLMFSSDFSSGV